MACLTDVPNLSFQCSDGKKEFQIAMDSRDGSKLECASPEDTEYFLKKCESGEVVHVTQCRYLDDTHFICKDVTDHTFEMPMELMNAYFCLTEQHRKRVEDRCRNRP